MRLHNVEMDDIFQMTFAVDDSLHIRIQMQSAIPREILIQKMS